MSDEQRRELERRRDLSPEESSRLLAARLRAGEIALEHVELAAMLGDPIAASVAPGRDPAWTGEARPLALKGRDVAVRAVVAAIRAMPADQDPADAERMELAIEGLEAWTLDQDSARELPLERAIESASLFMEQDRRSEWLRWALRTCRGELSDASAFGPLEVDAVRRELVAWALGRSDPVRARLQVRAQEAVEAWESGDPHRSGRLTFELLSPSQRIAWASAQLAACLERVERRPELLRVLDPREYQGTARSAHDVFDQVRTTTLFSDRNPGALPPALVAALFVAENAAKVIYNAHGHPAPFDHDAGWHLPSCVLGVAHALNDPDFRQRVDRVVVPPEVASLAARS